MIRFYSPDITRTESLPEEESKHCIRVLRHTKGDEIEVVDGKGNLYKCIIVDDNPKKTIVKINNVQSEGNPWKGHLAIGIAPTKNSERMEWLVEKLTEIGIDRIIPMCCEHSERKEIKTERLDKKIVSAMMQSLKTVKPTLDNTVSFAKTIEDTQSITQKFICYCDEHDGKEYLGNILQKGQDAIILIGPEGDFSLSEVKVAKEKGFRPVTLGPCRLRTETAALTAADMFHLIGMQAK